MKKAIFALSLLLFVSYVFGQLPQISGTINDKNTGEVVQGAIISDTSGDNYTYTNKNGYFSLGMGGGKYTIIVSASGFYRQIFHLDVYGPRDLNVDLIPLDPMVADTTSNLGNIIHDYRSGHTAPLVGQIQNMPSLLNQQDPVKFLQYLPGVNGGIEGLSGMNVRGGGADQNLTTMDGLPLYGSGHLFGFLSGFSPDQVRDIQFYRGVAPARYGGRSGAVMDVSMLDGNKNDWKGNYTFDPILMKLNMDGPISKRVSASIGIRRSWLDLLLPRTGGNYVFFNVLDLNLKVTAQINPNNKLSCFVYNGRDKYAIKISNTNPPDSLNRVLSIKLETSLTWQNTLAGVNLAHKFNNRHYAVFALGMSRYSYKTATNLEGTVSSDTGVDFAKIEYSRLNAITDFIAKGDFEYNLISGNYLRYGAEIVRHGFTPSVYHENLVSSGSGNSDSTYGKTNVQGALESSVYGEYETNLSTGLKMNLGGRLWLFSGSDKTYFYPEPRIMLSQMLQGNKALKLGFSIANQGVNQLASVNASLPGSAWFPASAAFTPQRTMQVTAGFYKPLKNGIEFTLDGYFKALKGVTDVTGRDEGDLLKNYWLKMLAQGKGKAYGLEAMLMKKHGRFNGVAAYTLSYSNRTIPDINFGKSFPFRWDRRHKFSLTGVYHINEILMINFGLVIMSGNAVSVPTGKYVAADGTFIYDYAEKNNFRMPLYRRFDVGFSKVIHPYRNSNGKQYWGINIYNMLNFYNPVFINLQKDTNNVTKAIGTSYFPFVPSAFYKWVF